MANDKPAHILLVEDDFAHADLVQRAFESRGDDFRISFTSSVSEARGIVDRDPPQLILADWQLPDGEGVDLLFQPSTRPDIPVVIMTSYGNERIAVEAIKAGAIDYIVKTRDTLVDMPHLADRVIQQWKVIAEKTRAENELALRAEAEAIWRTVGKTIASNETLEQVLSTVIQLVSEKMQVETGAILLWDPASQKITFAKVMHDISVQLESMRLEKGEGIVGWVIENGQPALVKDVKQDTRWQSRIDQQIGFNTRSILCVPLIANNITIGALELLNKQKGTFNETDLHLLETIALPLAIAIQNARLQSQIREQFDELRELFAKVAHAKREWEQTVDVLDSGIWVVDDKCQILRANRTLAKWLGTLPNTLSGKFCYQAIHHCDAPPEICPFKSSGTKEHPSEIQLSQIEGRTFRFSTFSIELEGLASSRVNVLQDITAEKALQSQLLQTEKLAAIGRLAASLAHEINNPLQALQGCLDLAQANPVNPEKQERYLSIAKSEVDRLAVMVQRMLDFYRPSKGARGSTNVKFLLDEVVTLSSKRLQHAKITTLVEWQSDIPAIECVASQIKQVFLNLVLNAIDAMPAGGDLAIRGRLVHEDHGWLCIDFTDTGNGIAPDDLNKIFEPFYTTKASGTGLGLGISHAIVQSHGGRLTVQSVVNKGSTFTMWLPTQPKNNS